MSVGRRIKLARPDEERKGKMHWTQYAVVARRRWNHPLIDRSIRSIWGFAKGRVGECIANKYLKR
jgi:hypothetical protein